MIHALKTLMDKVGSMQEQIDNVSRETEILRENKKENLEMKNTEKPLMCLLVDWTQLR